MEFWETAATMIAPVYLFSFSRLPSCECKPVLLGSVAGNKNLACRYETGGLFSLENRVSVNDCIACARPRGQGETKIYPGSA